MIGTLLPDTTVVPIILLLTCCLYCIRGRVRTLLSSNKSFIFFWVRSFLFEISGKFLFFPALHHLSHAIYNGYNYRSFYYYYLVLLFYCRIYFEKKITKRNLPPIKTCWVVLGDNTTREHEEKMRHHSSRMYRTSIN